MPKVLDADVPPWMTFFRAFIARIFLMAVVYLNSIAEERLLYRHARFLFFYQAVQPLRDGGVVEREHPPDDLVLSDFLPNRTADDIKFVVCLIRVVKIVLDLSVIIAAKPLKPFQG